jgi:hypothetical protein
MRYFLDTEFIEAGPRKPIQLVSIGIVAQDLRQLYRISADFNPEDANPWVKENVLGKLEDYERGSLGVIADDIRLFCDPKQFGKPEFWGYYADYDWVVFAQIFGTMMDLPEGFPMYCRDLKQLCDELGNPALPEQLEGEHNAMADAAWNMKVYDFLAKKKAA